MEIDSYVIIPVNTPIQELVLVALTRLGYPKEAAASAKGENFFSEKFDHVTRKGNLMYGKSCLSNVVERDKKFS